MVEEQCHAMAPGENEMSGNSIPRTMTEVMDVSIDGNRCTTIMSPPVLGK